VPNYTPSSRPVSRGWGGCSSRGFGTPSGRRAESAGNGGRLV